MILFPVSTIFNDGELKDLMSEVAGDKKQILWCDSVVSGNIDFDRGISREVAANCREVWGYVLSDTETEVAVDTNTFSAKGDFSKVIVLASDVPKSTISSSSHVVFNGAIYQVEFSQTYYDRGVAQLHELKLISTAAGGTHVQPDNILEYLT